MTDDPRTYEEGDEPVLTPEEQALVEARLAEDATPAADPAFRARLRAAFVAGALEAEGATAAPPPASEPEPSPPSEDELPTVVPIGPVGRATPRWSRWIPLAAAAALLLWVVTSGPDDGETWNSRGEHDGLRRAIVSGVEYDVGETDQSAFTVNGLTVKALAGTRLRSYDAADPGFHGLHVVAGELLVHTRSGYEGAGLEIRTRDETVRVTGTALSVMVNEHLTCICVDHGTVEVVGERTVGANETFRSYADGAEVTCEDWADMPAEAAVHQRPLVEFSARMDQ